MVMDDQLQVFWPRRSASICLRPVNAGRIKIAIAMIEPQKKGGAGGDVVQERERRSAGAERKCTAIARAANKACFSLVSLSLLQVGVIAGLVRSRALLAAWPAKQLAC